MGSIKEEIVEEAKRIEEDSLYSARGHFEAASVWSQVHLWIGVPTAVVSAIAGASALSKFAYHDTLAGILAIIVAAATAVTTFLNPSERARCHLDAGNSYNSLRNQARIFYDVGIRRERSDDELIGSLEELVKARDELNQNSPPIPGWAYRRAQRGIEEGQASYSVDEGGSS